MHVGKRKLMIKQGVTNNSQSNNNDNINIEMNEREGASNNRSNLNHIGIYINGLPIELQNEIIMQNRLKTSTKSLILITEVQKNDSDRELTEKPKKKPEKPQNSQNKCVICNKKRAKFKTNCGCFLCTNHKKKILSKKCKDKKLCPKCEVEITFADNEANCCQICLEPKKDLQNFHENCVLLVCSDCKKKCLSQNNKCPNCRSEVKDENKKK